MPRISLQKGSRLIATVRSYPGLYDPARRDYGNYESKKKVWTEVANKCGIKTGHEAKMMFKNLRDCYRICCNKLRANPNAKMWKFYPLMDFLRPYIKGRNFKRPQEMFPKKEGTEDNDDLDDLMQFPPPDDDAEITEAAENTEFNHSIDPEEIEYGINETPQKEETTAEVYEEEIHRPLFGYKRQPSEYDSDDEIYEDIQPENLGDKISHHSLRMFFDAMYASTNELPVEVQRRVKKAIFLAIAKYEEDLI